MANPEEKKTVKNENNSQIEPGERKGNWITDIYDKMNVPVKLLDAMLVILGLLIILLFVFGNKIQLGF